MRVSEDRLAHGCALVRSVPEADATTRHYAAFAARAFFRGAFEDEPGQVAARLWSAADVLVEDGSASGPRSRVLAICTEAGLEAEAGLPELRDQACGLAAELAEERPDVASYRPESDGPALGDPRRADVLVVDAASFLLALKEGSAWLDAEPLGSALDRGDDGDYQAVLRHLGSRCALAVPDWWYGWWAERAEV